MAVAKSFQSFDFLCKPFTENGKEYIKVRNPKTGTERKVRWYTNLEYAKLYPEEPTAFKNLKKVLGFEKGYITIFKNLNPDDEYFVCCRTARFHRLWGWYTISTEEPPKIASYKLYWSEIASSDELLKDDATIQTVFQSK